MSQLARTRAALPVDRLVLHEREADRFPIARTGGADDAGARAAAP